MSEQFKLLPINGEISIDIKIAEYIFNVRPFGESGSSNSSQKLNNLLKLKTRKSPIRIAIMFVEQFHEKLFST
jgi:hypothetical protein